MDGKTAEFGKDKHIDGLPMAFQAILGPGFLGHDLDGSLARCCPGLGWLCVQPKMRNKYLNNKMAHEEKCLGDNSK